ncbi:MAG: hypothetical protein JNL32_06175 [Candidatus Kapabacteria bacterium]|nr:hypothetical protein [Candidatus Kapabacteria bacterium]
MHRVKFLFGSFSGIFGLLYVFFGIVGFQDSLTDSDRYVPFLLAALHLAIGGVLLWMSHRDKTNIERRIGERVTTLLMLQTPNIASIIAEEFSISEFDANEYVNTLIPHPTPQAPEQ